MPFRKNFKREKILLEYWKQGKTVKTSAILSGIPEGTISHYFARFNKNVDKYHLLAKRSQSPPTTSPEEAAVASYIVTEATKKVKRKYRFFIVNCSQ